jgi:ATP-binding cassette, subfamily B, multidrug efflux pump
MTQMQNDDAFQKGFDLHLTKRILSYLKPYRWVVILVIVATFLTGILQPIFGLIQKQAIDCHLTFGAIRPTHCGPLDLAAPGSRQVLFDGLVTLVAIYLGLKLLEFAVKYLFTYALGWIGQHILYDIRSDVFSKLQRLHLGYYDRNPVGRLLTRVTSDVDAINQFITNGLGALVSSSVLVVAYVLIMLQQSWKLALVSFAVLPILFLATNYFRGKMRLAYRDIRIQQAIVNTQLNENITGMLTVQLFGREGRNQNKFDRVHRHFLKANLESIKWFSLFMPSTAFLGQVAVALVIWYGGSVVLGEAGFSDKTISLGILVAFVGWVGQLFQPIQDLADVFNNLQAAMASSERIFAVLDHEEQIQDAPNAKGISSLQGHVSLKNVWFSYDESVTAETPDSDERWILRGINLEIAPGESVALVGATGAGKTSIISLVSRFYDVQRGSVCLDGEDVRNYKQRDLRKHVGVVLQDVFLFAGTLESNLRMGNEAIGQQRIEEICKYVGVHDLISGLEGGYQTEVKERGATLSTGQKQLIAFARALIQNPDVVLVLDEATANVDTASEEQIQRALGKIMHDRTSIIIAHRLSTIEGCDRIVVMRKGKIIEQGSHQELLVKGGYYSRLYRLQYEQA